jgi:hypothetical protein
LSGSTPPRWGEHLAFSPGRHTVKVVAQFTQGDKRFETISNAVEIEITAAPPAPAAAAGVPEFRFIAPLGPRQSDPTAEAWTPEGAPAKLASLPLPDWLVPRPKPQQVPPRESTPTRHFCFWFSMPDTDGPMGRVDARSFIDIALLDEAGQPFAPPANVDTLTQAIPPDGVKPPGWLTATVCAGVRAPKTATVRLRYSTGNWSIPTGLQAEWPKEAKSGTRLEADAILTEIGQNALGHTFITYTRKNPQTALMQYGLTAITPDHRGIEPSAVRVSNTANEGYTETVEFVVKLDQVKAFLNRKRPIKTVEFKNVPLEPILPGDGN